MHQIVLIAFDGVQLLDVAGPAAAFGAAAEEGDAGYAVTMASLAGGEVRSSCGVTLTSVALGGLDPAAVGTVLVAGGDPPGLRALAADAAARRWLTTARDAGARHGSVCTGALVLAAWGLLDGQRAATHWRATAWLARHYPAVTVDAEAIFVSAGRLWTSAGVSTGIDMSLAMIEADHGAALATAVARRLVLYVRRPGSQTQFSALLDIQARAGPAYAGLLAWAAERLDTALGVEVLAARAGQSVRSFHRRFVAATGHTPAAAIEVLRLERARTLLGAGHAVKAVAHASGFGSTDGLARAFRRHFGLSPAVFRALHGGDRAACASSSE